MTENATFTGFEKEYNNGLLLHQCGTIQQICDENLTPLGTLENVQCFSPNVFGLCILIQSDLETLNGYHVPEDTGWP